MALLLYVVGLVVFVAGLGWAATAVGINAAYVNVAALILLTLGLFTAILRVRAENRS